VLVHWLLLLLLVILVLVVVVIVVVMVKRLALSNDEDKPTHYVNPERKTPPVYM
jgi:flagellar basal body-associated protein FliL